MSAAVELSQAASARFAPHWRQTERAIVEASLRRDGPGLDALIDGLAGDTTDAGRYYAGLAVFWRLSLPDAALREAGDRLRAVSAAVEAVEAGDPRMSSEKLAMQGSLGSLLVAASRGLQRAKTGFQTIAALDRAVRTDPSNPRAAFASACARLAMARPRSRDEDDAMAMLTRCDGLFAAPAERDALPGWGRSHLWLQLASHHARRDESVLAQSWLERFQRAHAGDTCAEAGELGRRLAGPATDAPSRHVS